MNTIVNERPYQAPHSYYWIDEDGDVFVKTPGTDTYVLVATKMDISDISKPGHTFFESELVDLRPFYGLFEVSV